MPPDAQKAPQDAGSLEVVQVPRKPGEVVCTRCGRVWRPSVKEPRWGIGPVHGVMASYCLACVRQIEREVVTALRAEPWDA